MNKRFEVIVHWLFENHKIRLSEIQLNQFQQYLIALQDWNQRMNLVADADSETIIVRHFLDSLTCLQSHRFNDGLTLLDIGAGAGFPGIPLKLVIPKLKVTLIESIQKKCCFLEHLISALRLEQAQVFCDRAEKLAMLPEHREQYDIVTTRALAELPVAAELALPFVKLQGTYLAMLGNDATEQRTAARMAISLCGGVIEQNIPIALPQLNNDHYLLPIIKTVPTPEQYPRRAGIPQKRPLVIT
jgi:16S rRNA (guanine527-N7)-methyltransferase